MIDGLVQEERRAPEELPAQPHPIPLILARFTNEGGHAMRYPFHAESSTPNLEAESGCIQTAVSRQGDQGTPTETLSAVKSP